MVASQSIRLSSLQCKCGGVCSASGPLFFLERKTFDDSVFYYLFFSFLNSLVYAHRLMLMLCHTVPFGRSFGVWFGSMVPLFALLPACFGSMMINPCADRLPRNQTVTVCRLPVDSALVTPAEMLCSPPGGFMARQARLPAAHHRGRDDTFFYYQQSISPYRALSYPWGFTFVLLAAVGVFHPAILVTRDPLPRRQSPVDCRGSQYHH